MAIGPLDRADVRGFRLLSGLWTFSARPQVQVLSLSATAVPIRGRIRKANKCHSDPEDGVAVEESIGIHSSE